MNKLSVFGGMSNLTRLLSAKIGSLFEKVFGNEIKSCGLQVLLTTFGKFQEYLLTLYKLFSRETNFGIGKNQQLAYLLI